MTGDWLVLAACRWMDPEFFFPTRGEDSRGPKAICARCVVRAECLDWALTCPEHFGVWGGTSERERRRMRRRMRAAGTATLRCRQCYGLLPENVHTAQYRCDECRARDRTTA